MSHFGPIRYADSPSSHEWPSSDGRSTLGADNRRRKAFGRWQRAFEWIGLLVVAILIIATGGVVGALISR
jgi:hypothetical protein